MPTDPHTPGRNDETPSPLDGEAVIDPDKPLAAKPKKNDGVKKTGGMTRRGLFRVVGLGVAALAASQIPTHDRQQGEQPRLPDVLGGVPPEGAEAFRRHLRALEGLVTGEDNSAQHLIPELRSEIHTYANLTQRIGMIERTMAGRLRQPPELRDAINTAEASNDVILRLMIERMEQQRRMEVANISRPQDAEELARLQRRNANLVAIIKTEINSLQSLVRHVETLASLSRAIENVPQMGDGRNEENRFLRETYGNINNQVQERMTPALRVLWGQMPGLATLNRLRSFFTSAHLTLRDRDLAAERNTIIPQLLSELGELADLPLPDPDGIRPGNGRDDRMTTALQTAAGAALRTFQRTPSTANKQACIAALDRLRHATLRETEKKTNATEAYLQVEKISITGLAFGGETDDYRAVVHLGTPPNGVQAARGRLADVTTLAARIERRRALHQAMRNLLGQRSDPLFERKMQALQFAYRQEMDIELEDMLRRVASNAQGVENALMGDTTMNYAGREAETVDPDAALARTVEQRQGIAAGQRGFSSMVEDRLLEHPEERADLERLVLAWREEGLNSGDSASFRAVVAQLRRMTIPVPPNPERNAFFMHWLNRLLVHAGVSEVYVPPLSSGQIETLAMQQQEYATSMVRHARTWINITDAKKPTNQEVLEEVMEMSFVGYRTRSLIDQAQRQQRELPWLIKFTYDTPVLNLIHKLAPTQIAYQLSGGKIGYDLRDIHRNGGTYMGIWSVVPPEYTAAALLGGDMEEQLNAAGVTRQQFETMTDVERKAILDRIQDRKSQTVLDVKRAHGPKITATGNGVINATNALVGAIRTAGMKKPEDLVTEREFVATAFPDCPETLGNILTQWRNIAGTPSASMAPVLVRGKLGSDPFKRMQRACKRANVNLMDYKSILRKPAGTWWGEGDTVDAAKIQETFDKGGEPRLSDEEWLWLYFKLLPGAAQIRGTPQQITQIMQRCNAEVVREEVVLAGMNRATKEERNLQQRRVFRARGALLAMYTQLSTQMQLQSDALALEQQEYMIDLGRSLGMHLGVAAVQYRLVDHDTRALPMVLTRAVETSASIYAAYKLIVRTPGYLWRKWRESVKFKRMERNLEKKLDAKYGGKMEELRESAIAAINAKKDQEAAMREIAKKFVEQLADVNRQIAECEDVITRGTAAPEAADATPVATEGADAATPVAEAKPRPSAGEVAIARTQLESLLPQREWLMSILADMVPDEEDMSAAEKDEKTPPATGT